MRYLCVTFLFLITPHLSAEDPLDLSLSIEEAPVFNQATDFSLSTEEAPIFNQATYHKKEVEAYFPQLPKVNVITGEYSEEEEDLIVAGAQPLSFRRFYNHLGARDRAYGHWRINPECLVFFNFESRAPGIKKLVAAGKPNGSILLFDKVNGGTFSFDLAKCKGFTNSQSISGGQHPLNVRVNYTKTGKPAKGRSAHSEAPPDGPLCMFEGTIQEGDGTIRRFNSDIKEWPQEGYKDRRWPPDAPPTFPNESYFNPPFQAMISEENLPNGNTLRYEYENLNAYPSTGAPSSYRIKGIKAYNKKNVLIGSIAFRHEFDPSDGRVKIIVVGSDGRKVTLANQVRKLKCGDVYDIVLEKVVAHGKPVQVYNTLWDFNMRRYEHAPFIIQARDSSGFECSTEYDMTTKKVVAQKGPIGPKGELEPLSRYEYNEGYTIVYDAENHKTIYRYDDNKRIVAIEKYQGEALHSIEKNNWDEKTGNLLKKILEDASGKVWKKQEFAYDERQNPIQETVGDETVSYTVYRSFSDDGRNLKTGEWDDYGRKVVTTYHPGTSLMAKEIVFEQGRQRKRQFCHYDDSAVCIKKTVDDGLGVGEEDLTSVTTRLITSITPKNSLPCYGLPEVVEEKTIDSTGREILLHKVIYTYAPSGKVLTEQHFDSTGSYRYTLTSVYDEQERLIAATDASGCVTSYAYDDRFNLTDCNGPRADMHQKITYDKANRPIVYEEKRSDGSWLAKRKEFNKLGQVTAKIDECGNRTTFAYDSLGQLISTTFADGSTENKQYDILGNVIAETDCNGFVTRKTYNFRGQPLEIHYSDGSFESHTYHPDGTEASHVDKNGALHLTTFDIFNHPIEKVVYVSGKPVKKTLSTFTPFTQLSETNAEGVVTTFSYDFAGRKTLEKIADKVTTFAYDSLGRQNRTQCGDTVKEITFDDMGREIRQAVLDAKGTLHREQRFAYDENGNRTHVIHSKGTFESRYDPQGICVWNKNPLGETSETHCSYLPQKMQTAVNPKEIQTCHIFDCRARECETITNNKQGEIIQRTECFYDGNGNQIRQVHHLYQGNACIGQTIHTWQYGPQNRLEKFIESGIKETTYLYDSIGRISEVIKPNGKRIHTEYDGLGRIAHYFAADFDYRYTYDALDRVLCVEDVIAKTKTIRDYNTHGAIIQEQLANGYTVTNSFDASGNRTICTLPDRSTISYTYLADKLYSVTRNNRTTSYERDLEGNVVQLVLPTGLGFVFIKRDALGRQIRSDGMYYESECKYDQCSNLISHRVRDEHGTQNNTYLYDELDQLIQENASTFQVDSLYNRRAKNAKPYTLSPLHEVTSDGEQTYTYDKNGNLLSAGKTFYTYDSLDRLTSVKSPLGLTTFTYDPFNRRLTKNKTRFIWDGSLEIGTDTELRVLGEGLGGDIGSAVLLELSGTTYIPYHDHRGSLVTLFNTKSGRFTSYRYTAFGEPEQPSLSPWSFSSKRLDPETNFYYFGRRYYSAPLGRFITPDPSGFSDGPNLYAYVRNCPFTKIDKYGLRSDSSWKSHDDQDNPYRSHHSSRHYKEDRGYEDRFSNKSHNYVIMGYSYKDGKQIAFTNGLRNSIEDAVGSSCIVFDLADGRPVYGTYNASNGGLNDIKKGKMHLDDRITTASYKKLEYWLNSPPEVIFFEICHSDGVSTVWGALMLAPQQIRDRVIVAAFCPGRYITRDLCKSVIHYVSRSDIVPSLDVKGMLEAHDTIKMLKPHRDSSYFDHSFASPTYRPYLESEIRDFLGNLKN